MPEYSRILKVLHGEDRPRHRLRGESAWERLIYAEEGLISLVLMLSILFFLVLGGIVFNIGNLLNRKLDTQNAADAIAYSSTLWIARGMNAMTATNHMMGELTALYVIHHALGGRYMDETTSPNNTSEMRTATTALTTTFETAKFTPGTIPVQDVIHDRAKLIPAADMNSMIYQSKLNIKTYLAIAFGVHTAGKVLEKVPFCYFAGVAVQAAALASEWALFKEWVVLDLIEKAARPMTPIKKRIPTMLRAVYGYQGTVLLWNMPRCAKHAAEKIAQEHNVNGHVVGHVPTGVSISDLLGIMPALPVEKEVTNREDRSQLIRATHPWVHYWRTPINEFLGSLAGAPISESPKYYSKYTSLYTLQACEWLRFPAGRNYRKHLTIRNYRSTFTRGSGEKGHDLKLFVVKGLNGREKSRERWAMGSNSEVEKLFVHMGLAHEPEPPKISVSAIFPQTNPKGFLCLAQSMIYNANKQQRPAPYRGPGRPQPEVGWDTLNWTAGAPEYKSIRRREDAGEIPRIKLNWQAKLTPVTPEKVGAALALTILDADVRDIAWNSKLSFGFMCH